MEIKVFIITGKLNIQGDLKNSKVGFGKVEDYDSYLKSYEDR